MWNLNGLFLLLHLKHIDDSSIQRWIRARDTGNLMLALRFAPHYEMRLLILAQLSRDIPSVDPRLVKTLIRLIRNDLPVVADRAAELIRKLDGPTVDRKAIAAALDLHEDRLRRRRNFLQVATHRGYANVPRHLVDKDEMKELARIKKELNRPVRLCI